MERERIHLVNRIADDTGGGLKSNQKKLGSLTSEISSRVPQTYSPTEIASMLGCNVEYASADRRWYSAYSQHVSEETRRFLISLARFISRHDYAEEFQLYIVRCVTFYHSYFEGRHDSVTPKAMGARVRQYASADLLSHDVHRGANYMWFEPHQRCKLIDATIPVAGAIAFPVVKGRPLSPPAK